MKVIDEKINTKTAVGRKSRISGLFAALLLTAVQAFPQAGVAVSDAVGPAVANMAESRMAPSDRTLRPTHAFGGLILPKIRLENCHSLAPWVEAGDMDCSRRKEELTGLIVFHTGSTGTGQQGHSLPKGVYVWDGSQWLRISLPIAEQDGKPGSCKQ